MGALLLGLGLLASCNKMPSEPLRIASSPWPGYEPLYLARDLGYLPKDQVNVFELPSSDITYESFRNHSSDMATLTLDETLKLLESGVKLRILFAIDSSNGADAVLATPQVKSLADIKGKRFIITNIPLGAYMLSRTLDAAKLTRADVEVTASSENKHPDLYQQGKADVFYTFEPFKSQLLAMGAHVIFDSSQIPNEIFDLMLVHEDVYQARRSEVCKVAKQWFYTQEYIKDAPEDAVRRMAKRLGATPQEFALMQAGISTPDMPENLRLLSGKQPAIVEPAKKLQSVMLKNAHLKRGSDIHVALDADIQDCLAK